jgi:hypothetical protein
LVAAFLLFLLAAVTVNAQQINGTPVRPAPQRRSTEISAGPTGAVSGVVPQRQRLQTVLATTVSPKGAPNGLIMTDDACYGVSVTFCVVITTPALDRIAHM